MKIIINFTLVPKLWFCTTLPLGLAIIFFKIRQFFNWRANDATISKFYNGYDAWVYAIVKRKKKKKNSRLLRLNDISYEVRSLKRQAKRSPLILCSCHWQSLWKITPSLPSIHAPPLLWKARIAHGHIRGTHAPPLRLNDVVHQSDDPIIIAKGGTPMQKPLVELRNPTRPDS